MTTHSLNFGTQMAPENTQKLINYFTNGAKLNPDGISLYTTHTFWQGGAQHQFMYASVGKWWTLDCVRWWGGWAEGESVRIFFQGLRGANVCLPPE
jgi:hypothetical protein